MPDTMSDHRRRVDEYTPGALARARTPCERRALVRLPRVDAPRIDDMRMHELPALVERAELLPHPVHRLAGRESERGDPLPAFLQPADRRKAGRSSENLVRRRSCHGCAAMEESDTQ